MSRDVWPWKGYPWLTGTLSSFITKCDRIFIELIMEQISPILIICYMYLCLLWVKLKFVRHHNLFDVSYMNWHPIDFQIIFIGLHLLSVVVDSSSTIPQLSHQRGSLVVEHSLRAWEARVRFPAESSQRFQIGSWSSLVKCST